MSSHLTLSAQRSPKEEVQERVARIQADMSAFKDEQLETGRRSVLVTGPGFQSLQVFKTRKARIAACTGKSRQWGYELVGLCKSRSLALKNGASEEQLPDSNEDAIPKPQSQSPVNPSRKALNGDHNDTLEIAEIPFRLIIESGIPIPAERTYIDIKVCDIRALFGDDELSGATRIQMRDRLTSLYRRGMPCQIVAG